MSEESKPDAIVYRHCDGYPEGLGCDLKRFVKLVSTLRDKRFYDPEYLAAKWVVFDAISNVISMAERSEKTGRWKVEGFIVKSASYLNFVGVGVCVEDHGDVDYIYRVICDGKPTLKASEITDYGLKEVEIPEPKED